MKPTHPDLDDFHSNGFCEGFQHRRAHDRRYWNAVTRPAGVHGPIKHYFNLIIDDFGNLVETSK